MTAAAAAPAPAHAEPTPQKKSGMLWKIGILLFVLAIIGAECGLAVMYVSSAEEKIKAAAAEEAAAALEKQIAELDEPDAVDAHEESEHAEHGSHDEHGEAGEEGKSGEHGSHGEHGKDGDAHGGHGEHGKKKDKHKDSYFIPKGEPADLEVDMGNFSLTASRGAATIMINFHLWGGLLHKDEEEFTEKYAANMQRIREKVIETVRAAAPDDLNDPGLGLIKRQILAKTNQALGKVLLQEVIVSDFVALEQ